MLKINSYHLFLLSTLFCVNSTNVLYGSFNQPNKPSPSHEVSSTNTPSDWGPNNSAGIFTLPIADNCEDLNNNNRNNNIPKQENNPPLSHAVNSTHTPSDWGPNNSAGIYNINSLPIADDCKNFNNNNRNKRVPKQKNNSPLSHDVNSTHTPSDWGPNNSAGSVLKNGIPIKKDLMCFICNKNLPNHKALNFHVKAHYRNRQERSYQCNLCPKSFSKKSILKNHRRRHKKKNPFKCAYCPKGFTTKLEKTTHEHTHTGAKLFKCFICQKPVASKNMLKNHIQTHKGSNQHHKLTINENLYKCSECSRAYATKSGLKYHLNIHKPKPYTCRYCDATFAYKSEYEKHMRYEEATDENVKSHR